MRVPSLELLRWLPQRYALLVVRSCSFLRAKYFEASLCATHVNLSVFPVYFPMGVDMLFDFEPALLTEKDYLCLTIEIVAAGYS